MVVERTRQQTTATPLSITELLRDPYVIEFTGLFPQSAFTETELETTLRDHLQSFLLELGTGFCFEARQQRITVGNTHTNARRSARHCRN